MANVAFLPGIQMASLAMPDIHWGYGFCIGGVSATDPAEGGVISPGGVGYDINCGVRLMRTNLIREDVQPRLDPLMDALFRCIPAGVGTGGPYLFGGKELRRLLAEGRALPGHPRLGHARRHRAHRGRRLPARRRARYRQPAGIERGGDQCGTLGSGNHFLEVQIVDEVRRRGGRPDDGPGKGPGLRDDPFRLARAGLPGVRRLAGRPAQSAGEVRHRVARPAVGLRPGR